jgi:Cu+-exporting ATPase
MGCATTIERTVGQIEGVQTALVNFGMETLSVKFDPKKTSAPLIMKNVKGLGYNIFVKKDLPEEATGAEHDHRHDFKEAEIQLLRNKFITGAVISGLILVVPSLGLLSKSNADILMMLLALPVQFIIGKSFYKSFIASLKNKIAIMDTLIALGTSAAFFYGMLVIVFRDYFEKIGAAHTYFDTSAVIITLIILGRYLEAVAKNNASSAIEKLSIFDIKTARVIRKDRRSDFQIEKDLPLEEIRVNDIVAVKAGEKIPVDGIVAEGSSSVDESMISGETMPKEVNPGDSVIGGTMNKDHFLKIQTTKIGRDTFLAQISRLVAEAQLSKAPVQKLSDSLAEYFVPLVIAMSLITFIGWYLWGPSLNLAITNFIAVLIIGCPCALGLATPLAIMVSSAKAAKRGIIIQDAASFEALSKVDAIFFDKTGTITKGKPVVTDIIIVGSSKNITKESILKIVSSLEIRSEHPLAQALVNEAKNKDISPLSVVNYRRYPGMGISGEITKNEVSIEVFLGNLKLLENRRISISSEAKRVMDGLEAGGKTVMSVVIQKELSAIIGFLDVPKKEARDVIGALKKAGKKIFLMTGDNPKTAVTIAREIGIPETNVFAHLTPQEKEKKISELQATGDKVAMVGDNINDAPALSRADISISLGTRTDLIMESGGITLISDNLEGVLEVLKLSKKTFNTIKENIFWAVIYNIILLPLAAGALYPHWGRLLDPTIAGAAMAVSSLSVIINSLRLKED